MHSSLQRSTQLDTFYNAFLLLSRDSIIRKKNLLTFLTSIVRLLFLFFLSLATNYLLLLLFCKCLDLYETSLKLTLGE